MTSSDYLRESCYIKSLTDCRRKIETGIFLTPNSIFPSKCSFFVALSPGQNCEKDKITLQKSLPAQCKRVYKVITVRHRGTRKFLSETSVHFYQTTSRHFSEDGSIQRKHTFPSNKSEFTEKLCSAIINMDEKVQIFVT